MFTDNLVFLHIPVGSRLAGLLVCPQSPSLWYSGGTLSWEPADWSYVDVVATHDKCTQIESARAKLANALTDDIPWTFGSITEEVGEVDLRGSVRILTPPHGYSGPLLAMQGGLLPYYVVSWRHGVSPVC